MPHRFRGERTLMRIFVGESDKALAGPHAGQPLHEALVQTFRERGFAGATVTRAIAGFGASAVLHTAKILRLSLDLPLVIEVVETEQRIQEILPDLDELIGGGLITLERVRVILYRPGDMPEDERRLHRIDGLGPDGPADGVAPSTDTT
jgi:PII-like signaling protein